MLLKFRCRFIYLILVLKYSVGHYRAAPLDLCSGIVELNIVDVVRVIIIVGFILHSLVRNSLLILHRVLIIGSMTCFFRFIVSLDVGYLAASTLFFAGPHRLRMSSLSAVKLLLASCFAY